MLVKSIPLESYFAVSYEVKRDLNFVKDYKIKCYNFHYKSINKEIDWVNRIVECVYKVKCEYYDTSSTKSEVLSNGYLCEALVEAASLKSIFVRSICFDPIGG